MSSIAIRDANDPQLADYALLANPTALRQRNLFVAEGRLVVRRLLDAHRFRIRSLLLSPAAADGLTDALAGRPADVPVYVAPLSVMAAVTGYNIHRGCLALVERPAALSVDRVVTGATTVVVLERIVDVDNMGAIFRNAAAFHAEAVLLSPGCCDPLYRKAVRTSAGAALALPFAIAEAWPDALDDLRQRGFVVIATTPDASARDIGDAVADVRSQLVAVLLGSEGYGLSDDAIARADLRVRIPIAASVDSLNVATAAAIALQRIDEARRRQ